MGGRAPGGAEASRAPAVGQRAGRTSRGVVQTWRARGWGVVMDLGGWLRSLGLERYEASFRENEIDDTVLASLTHETLKELGVTALGHRPKILDAIAVRHAAHDAKEPPPASASNAFARSPTVALRLHLGTSCTSFRSRISAHGGQGGRGRESFLVHTHMLRHACGFKLANDGHDTRAIQAYLAHRSIMSTVRYTALTPNRFKNFWKD
jgi:hypothetical protein